jgi:hypothetical protein
MVSADNVTLNSGKYIKLVSPGGGTVHILKRASGNTASPLITVNGGQLTLQNIIIDGGAVWASGSANPPSPAFGATNTGTGAVTASKTLVFASGAGAKLTLGAGAVLRNNCTSSAGGGISANTGAEVIINGGEVCYNQSGYTGGGIVLQDATQMNTKLTMINGSINNNKSAPYDGGGINAEYGTIAIQGGFITKNLASTNGGGINVNAGTGANTMTISGGEISGNIAGQRGGGIKAGQNYTVTMSGGVISGNTAGTGYTGNGVHVGDVITPPPQPTVFKMSGGARIDSGNDVYLISDKYITIGGNLTGAAPVAVITPASYTAGTVVLSGTVVSANYSKFAVTPNPNRWYIGPDGKLTYDAASGGTITTVNAGAEIYQIHTFSAPGTFTLNGGLAFPDSFEYLIAAGGGGGGFSDLVENKAGGGGAGGLIHRTGQTLLSIPYTVIVGSGGAGGASEGQNGSNGGDSSFNGESATGGGGGGYHRAGAASNGNNGGSGGGSAHSTFGNGGTGASGQGNNGSKGKSNGTYYIGGGGGGAGAAGSDDRGGAGLQKNITGTALYYAGGGAGGWSGAMGGSGGGGSVGVNSGNGENGTGGGGAGGYATAGGRGGDGVVIIRFRIQ